MAFLLPIAAIASTALGVASSISQGRAAKKNAQADAQAAAEDFRRQADADLKNAGRLREQASVLRYQTGAEEDLLRRQQRGELSAVRGAIAESGFEFSGTQRDLMDDSDVQAELEVLTLRYQGEMEARSIESDAQSLAEQAGLTAAKIPSALAAGRRQASQIRTATALNVGANIIGGVANYAGARQSLLAAQRG
jgi:hypothetical protein